MSKKNNIKKATITPKKKDSVFSEAWGNMNEDMGKVLPDFLARRLQKREGKIWVMVAFTFIELVLLGVVGKFVYDWFMK